MEDEGRGWFVFVETGFQGRAGGMWRKGGRDSSLFCMLLFENEVCQASIDHLSLTLQSGPALNMSAKLVCLWSKIILSMRQLRVGRRPGLSSTSYDHVVFIDCPYSVQVIWKC